MLISRVFLLVCVYMRVGHSNFIISFWLCSHVRTYSNRTDIVSEEQPKTLELAPSNGITAVLADDGRVCIDHAREQKASTQKAERTRALEKRDQDTKHDRHGSKSKEGPRQRVKIMIAQYEELSPVGTTNKGNKTLNDGLKPFIDGIEAFVPILQRAREISSQRDWKPAVLTSVSNLQQKPRGWESTFALPIIANTTSTNVQLVGFVDDTVAFDVMKGLNMTAFLIGGL